jgi:hypothetical protein
MSNIGFKVLKIGLEDAVEKQQLIFAELQELPLHSKVHKLAAEQSEFLYETLTLLNHIA